jgi:hypothetical protein
MKLKLAAMAVIVLAGCGPAQPKSILAPATTLDVVARNADFPQSISILNGRATLRFPAKAKQQARAGSIMGPQDNPFEDRVLIEPGADKATFIVMANELLLVDGGDMAANMPAIVKRLTQWEVTSSRMVKLGTTSAIEYEANFVGDDARHLVGYAVAASNGEVFSFDFLAQPDASKAGDYAKQARAIANTLALGKHLLQSSSGFVDSPDGLHIAAPPGFVVMTEHGADFTVSHTIATATPFADGGLAITMYVGEYPHFRPGPAQATETGQLFGKPAIWYTRNEHDQVGVVCGVRVQDITDPLMQKIRYMDKLVYELAKGKTMAVICGSHERRAANARTLAPWLRSNASARV